MDCYPGRHTPTRCRNAGSGETTSDSRGIVTDSEDLLQPPPPPSHGIDAGDAAGDADVGSLDPLARSGTDPSPRSSVDSGAHSVSDGDLPSQTSPPTGAGASARPTNAPDTDIIQSTYDAIVHWKKKFFKIPTGSVGKALVNEMASLLEDYIASNGHNASALLRFAVLPALLLQRTCPGSRAADNAKHLRRRLDLWSNGDIASLVEEGNCLQDHSASGHRPGGRKRGQPDAGHEFATLMSNGQVHQALRSLSPDCNTSSKGGVLQIDDVTALADGSSATVREVLAEKHPAAAPADPAALLSGDPPSVHPICFDRLTGELLKSVALHCQGSAGPSGLDSRAWRRICSAYKGASARMCQALASFSRLVATVDLPVRGLAPFLACRLIALDKNPGVRPIGVCEVFRRIVARAVLKIVGPDVEEVCGPLQTCSGLPSGIEAAVHAMQQLYEADDTEGVLLVDARNAFNSLNREVALHNVQRLCPSLARTVVNCYAQPARLFVAGGGELASSEGTTQGDPLSMAFYALATVPLLLHLRETCPSTSQGWYADDSSAADRLRALRAWWRELESVGPRYGYFTNSAKSMLLVKPGLMEDAGRIFGDTGIRLLEGGVQYLGSNIGEQTDRDAFLVKKIEKWCGELHSLAKIAESEPHAAYAALTHGLRGRWTYIFRTLQIPPDFLVPLEMAIGDVTKAVTGRLELGEEELTMLRLPARLGGIGLPDVRAIANNEHVASKSVTDNQVLEIVHQTDSSREQNTARDIHQSAIAAKASIGFQRKKQAAEAFRVVHDSAPPELAARLERISTKGVSSWLVTLPLAEHGFHLNKRDFRDALALRYNWPIPDLPTSCACGQPFTTCHAMCCPRGGFPTIRHNEVRDILADLLTEVSHNVATEPLLLPLSGETFSAATTNTSNEARADIRVSGFWSRGEDAFFDVRVFHPDASSYRDRCLEDMLKLHEDRKTLEYGERITNVDHGSFTPLVFTTDGCSATHCLRFLKSLCSRLATHDNRPYSQLMAFVRGRLSFALLRSAIMCLRGSRSAYHRPVNALREVAIVEGGF